MTQINFGIKFSPRDSFRRFRKNEKEWVRASDTYLKQLQRAAVKVTKRNAPGPGSSRYARTGNLRRQIRAEPVRVSKTGKIDRRANITVISHAPYTKYVVAGAKPSTGDGKTPGSGKFIPAGGGFRIKFGTWPGFKANDFLVKSQVELLKVNRGLTLTFFNTMSASHRRLGNR